MKNTIINRHPTLRVKYTSNDFEDSVYNSGLLYSLSDIINTGLFSFENTSLALQKSLHVCNLAGINSKHHFKKIYTFDVLNKTFCTDWRISKTGFGLLIVQMPNPDIKMAAWLWKLIQQQTS